MVKGAVAPAREEHDRQTPPDPGEDARHGTWQRLAAEVLGTAVLVFASAAPAVARATHHQVPKVVDAVAPGLVIMILVFALGHVSGAHVNPAVTLSFALRGVFPWRAVPLYWVAQVAGAMVGGRAVAGVWSDEHGLLDSRSLLKPWNSVLLESLLTGLLVMAVLGTATRERLLGPQAAIPVGATIAVDGLLGASSSGAAMNPARALAPALSWGTWPADGWVYLVGPFTGAVVATVVAFCVFGGPRAEEHKAAVGSEGKQP